MTSPSASQSASSPPPASANELETDDYELRKRVPARLANRPNDVYVTGQSNFKSQMGKCHKLLDGGQEEVFLHAMGNAVNRAIAMALQIKRRGMGAMDLDINTDTVQVTDDLFPLLDDADLHHRTRLVSAVHIRIFRPQVPVDDY